MMSFKDHEVEVGMAIGEAVGSNAELFPSGGKREGASLKQVAAGISANGVKIYEGAPTGWTADFAMGDAKGFVAQAKTETPQISAGLKIEQSFGR